jgi:signal transduction histidine kinase
LLLALGLAGCSAAALSVTLVLGGDEGREPRVRAGLVGWITLSYVLCGLVAWWRRADSRLGPLMVVASFATFVSNLSFASSDVLFTIGELLHLLPPVLFLHVFLAYPSGRLESRFERTVVEAAYMVAVGFGLVRMLLGGFDNRNLFDLFNQADAAHVVRSVQAVVISALALAGIALLVARRVRAGRAVRRSRELVVDSFVFALVMVAVGAPVSAFQPPAVEPIRWAGYAVVGAAPLAFLFALLGARLARSAIGDLFVELRGEPAPAELRDALARALGDNSLTLAYWLPDFESYADLEGQPVELPTHDPRKTTTLIERDGVRVAALVHDASLDDEPELLAAVGAAAGIALENGRLHVEQRAHLEELRGSRARVIEAGQKERQRLERNLHDGAQQRLIALSLELSRLEKDLGRGVGAGTRIEEARREIAHSLDELRAVARGLHPAVLSGHGLGVALESIAAHATVPVRLTVAFETRLPEPIEVAAYYVVSESLANVGKHAEAKHVSIDVARTDQGVVIEVVDDGVGGADRERGSGLRGLADRVEAHGGRLRVWSPRGGGTRVRAEMPCG